MPLFCARSNSRTSSSTNRTRRKPSEPRFRNGPDHTNSSIVPALPSRPQLEPSTGPLNKSCNPASQIAFWIVFSLLFDMIPNMREASRRAFSLGANILDLSSNSTGFLLRLATAPDDAVRVPSKSKNTAATSPDNCRRSFRFGSGVPGVTVILYVTDEQLEGVAITNDRCRVLVFSGVGLSGEASAQTVVTSGVFVSSVMLRQPGPIVKLAMPLPGAADDPSMLVAAPFC